MNEPNYQNFIFNKERGFIFAYVPKVACTNWKSLLRYMAGFDDWLDNKLAHDKINGGLRYLDLSGPDVDLLSDPKIHRYTMVRDPYSRTLSAYLNKVEKRLPPKPKGGDHFDMIVCAIDAWRATHMPGRKTVDFEVFLNWLHDSGSPFAENEHWVPQTILLRHPEVPFDRIGRFENLSADSGEMLAAMGCYQRFPSQQEVKFASTGAAEKLARYYTATARALVNALYAPDFAAYGYEMVIPEGPRSNTSGDFPAMTPAKPTRKPYSMAGRAYATRKPLKCDALAVLRDMGVAVETVLDIGVQTVTEELIAAYPDRPHLLVEPVIEYHRAIERRYSAEGIAHTLAPVAASDTDGKSDLVVRTVGGGDTITHARLADAPVAGASDRTRTVLMRKVDTLVAEQSAKPPFLLKIDVDGAELRILKGATRTLQDCNIVVIEAQIRNFLERAALVVAAGFELFDIVDLCYHDHRLSQFDMVFVNRAMLEREGKTIFARGFDPTAWFKLAAQD